MTVGVNGSRSIAPEKGTVIGGSFTFTGTVESSGETSIAVTGITSSQTTFTGNFSFTGGLTGTWVNMVAGISETFAGSTN